MQTKVTLAESSATWLSSMSKKVAASTLRAYRGELGRMCEHLASAHRLRTLAELKSIHWATYLETLTSGRTRISGLRKDCLADRSVVQTRRITRSFLNWCFAHELISWSPVLVEVPSTATTSSGTTPTWRCGSLLRPLELEASLLHAQQARSASVSDQRAAMVACLAYWGALRSPQIASLRLNDVHVDEAQDQIAIRTRDDPRRWVPLPTHAATMWMAYRTGREKAHGHRLVPKSPVIASLKGEQALSAWTIWSIAVHWGQICGGTPVPTTPRAMRAAFIEHAGQAAAEQLQVLAHHAGVRSLAISAANP